ncbi:hypothetical protein DCAR_0520356 [Daucus carota subsp. sativus]|uniref:Uncharacterized protein n=1 Tax=Daucus carota subsp. sativus TaxID=79200 RepID=A0A164YHK7_DAUCS|nr:hypothetical protein DCAR_0520356 [Daucus carota subsp. sativus]
MKLQYLNNPSFQYRSKHLVKDPKNLAPIIQTYAKTKQIRKGNQLHTQLIA